MTADIYRLLIEKQRGQLPYYLCPGLAIGFSHEKTIWTKEPSDVRWADVVKGTFIDDQWIQNKVNKIKELKILLMESCYAQVVKN